MELKGKVAVVTGASSGIGLEIARHLVDRQATVYGFARGEDRLTEARRSAGNGFHPVVCDVGDEDQVKQAIEQVASEAGRIDILINNAGLGRYGRVEELSAEDWDIQMYTNLRGVFLCTRAVIPHMRRQNQQNGFGGHVVNIASIAGLLGNPTMSAYNATKFGVRGFSEAVMKEVRDDGIKVSCIYPGSVATNFSAISGGGGSHNPMTSDDIAGTVLHVLETSDNYLISEVVMRPLRPKG